MFYEYLDLPMIWMGNRLERWRSGLNLGKAFTDLLRRGFEGAWTVEEERKMEILKVGQGKIIYIREGLTLLHDRAVGASRLHPPDRGGREELWRIYRSKILELDGSCHCVNHKKSKIPI
jgi:hypothetical protein